MKTNVDFVRISRLDLDRAANDPELANPATEDGLDAVVRLMVARGYVRISDPLAENRSSVGVETILSAVPPLLEEIAAVEEDARLFASTFDSVEEPVELEEGALSLLRSRRDLWAAFVTVSDLWEVALDSPAPMPDGLQEGVYRLSEALTVLDAVMAESPTVELLAACVDAEWLDVERRRLAGVYAEMPPWWLDGRFERLNARAEQDYRDDMKRMFGGPVAGPVVVSWVGRYYPQFLDPVRIAASVESPVGEPSSFSGLSADGATSVIMRMWGPTAEDGMRLEVYRGPVRASDLDETVVALNEVPSSLDIRGVALFTMLQMREIRSAEPVVQIGDSPERITLRPEGGV